jgi:hypothetical protein
VHLRFGKSGIGNHRDKLLDTMTVKITIRKSPKEKEEGSALTFFGFQRLERQALDLRICESVKSNLLSAKRGSRKNLLWVQIFRKENRRAGLEFFGPVKGKRSCWHGPSDPWVEEGNVINDHIDKMFSRFSVTLKRKNVGSLPSLIEGIKKVYIPEPIFHILQETNDMRRFIQGSHHEEKCIGQLNGISFQHQFCFKKHDGKTLTWGKKYSTTAKWGPSSGLSFLKFVPYHPIFSSKLVFLQHLLKSIMHRGVIEM